MKAHIRLQGRRVSHEPTTRTFGPRLPAGLRIACLSLVVACTGPQDDETDPHTGETGSWDTGDTETGDTEEPLPTCAEAVDLACGSLFAARIYALQCTENPEHRGGCDAPLSSDLGALNDSGDPLCVLERALMPARSACTRLRPIRAASSLAAARATTV